MRLRIVARAGPIRTAISGAERQRGNWTARPAKGGWIKHRSHLEPLGDLERLASQSRREVDQIIDGNRLAGISRRLGRKRLRWRIPLTRYIALWNGTFFNRPNRLARHTIKDVQKGFLAWNSHRFNRSAVHVDVGEYRRGRKVIVPNRMVNNLEVPLPLACFQIDADETLAKQIVPRPMPPVEVGCGRFDGQIDKPQFLVH